MVKRLIGVFDHAHKVKEMICRLLQAGIQPEQLSIVSQGSLESISEVPELLGGLNEFMPLDSVMLAGPIKEVVPYANRKDGLEGVFKAFQIPADKAAKYCSYIEDGKLLLMVDTYPDQNDLVQDIFLATNENNETTAEQQQGQAQANKLPLREEKLNVEKKRVLVGQVTINKEVVEELKTISVPVIREEMVIERTVYDATSPEGRKDVIRIPLTEEQIEVTKQTVITGEINVFKREVKELKQIAQKVRKEVPAMEVMGEVEIIGEHSCNQFINHD